MLDMANCPEFYCNYKKEPFKSITSKIGAFIYTCLTLDLFFNNCVQLLILTPVQIILCDPWASAVQDPV